MHPIERLRLVAGVEGGDPGLVATEAGHALAAVAAQDPAGLVPACRRLLDRHTTSGPMWWLAARVLAAPDPLQAAQEAAAALSSDALISVLVERLPDEETVAVVGWPAATGEALGRRGDVEVVVIDGRGQGSSLARRLDHAGVAAVWVSDAGAASAVVVSGLVVIEALAAGPSGVLARIGSRGAAAVAAHAGVPVWLAGGVGRVLPGELWDALLARVDAGGSEPWDRDVELVPAALITAGVGPDGTSEVAPFLTTSTAPLAPELLRTVE